MKRIYLMIITLCLPLLICSQADAQHTGPYVGAFLGGNYLMSSQATDNLGSFGLTFDPGFQGSAVAGWDFGSGNPVGEGRVELEYNHSSSPLKEVKLVGGSAKGGGSVVVDSLLLNCWGVFHNKSFWAPYVGLGAGAARMEASGLKVIGQPLASGTSTVFAYQLGVGVDLALTDYLNLDLGYRFFNSTQPKFTEVGGSSFKMDYLSHSAVLGLRVGF
jgi:opacity protein-like surface antigen